MDTDKFLLVLLGISAAIFTIFFRPLLDELGLAWLSILYYVLFFFTFIYGHTAYSLRQRRER